MDSQAVVAPQAADRLDGYRAARVGEAALWKIAAYCPARSSTCATRLRIAVIGAKRDFIRVRPICPAGSGAIGWLRNDMDGELNARLVTTATFLGKLWRLTVPYWWAQETTDVRILGHCCRVFRDSPPNRAAAEYSMDRRRKAIDTLLGKLRDHNLIHGHKLIGDILHEQGQFQEELRSTKPTTPAAPRETRRLHS